MVKAVLFIALIFFNSAYGAGSLMDDRATIEKVAEKLIKNFKFKMHFGIPDTSHVVLDFKKNVFHVSISEKDYDEPGSFEGGLALVCHELGHAAGGSLPVKGQEYSGGVSSEEDADYWAGKICMPEMIKAFNKKKTTKISPFEQEFKKSCESFPSEKEKDVCLKGLRGSYLFRNNAFYANMCGSQPLSYKDQGDFNKTPYKGKRGPNVLQCSFNNMAAGVLKQKQPSCENLVMSFGDIYNERCEENKSARERLGVIEDDPTPVEGIVDTNRSGNKRIEAPSQSADSAKALSK